MNRPSRLRFAACALFVLFVSVTSVADVFDPALLGIVEREAGWFDVTWKVSVAGDAIPKIEPVLPENMRAIAPPATTELGGSIVQRTTYTTDGKSVVGGTIVLEGLQGYPMDAVVQVTLLDGTYHSAILKPSDIEFVIPAKATKGEVAVSYWKMGFVHILEGTDHLLFLLALFFIIAGYMPILKAVTAFTVAHSITLALATLGFLHMPPSPTEAVIALSIVFLASEVVHKHYGRKGLTERYPWAVTFVFGLVHGLGFAGALSEIGVPGHEVPLALLMFNVGVESGQVVFLTGVAILIAGLRRVPISIPGAWRLAPYAIGSVAMFWTIQRVASMLAT